MQHKGANMYLGGCFEPYEDALMENFGTNDVSKLPMKFW